MIKCLAIDDEPLALQLLVDNISQIPFLNLVASCEDAFAANKIMQEQAIDLVFIDIQMPGITGLQFIHRLVKKPLVIIVSAYKQYALDGFALNIVDYLVKPVAVDRFLKACNKANDLFQLNYTTQQSYLIKQGHAFVNVDQSLVKINFDEISYIESLNDFVHIYLSTSSKPTIVQMSLITIEEELPPNFERIHKSCVVNIDKITSVKKETIFIEEKELPITESYRQHIVKRTGKN